LKLAKTFRRAFSRLRDFKAWNGFHDLLIKISSDVIAGARYATGIIRANGEPLWQDKAADWAALSLNAGRR
jgi:hypothetical protein